MIYALLFSLWVTVQQDDGWSKTAGSFKAAISGVSDAKLADAVSQVAQDNSERAAKLLLSGLSTGNLRFYWTLINGLSKMTAKEPVACIAETILARGKPVDMRRDLMMALQLNLLQAGSDALLRIGKSGEPRVQIIAIDELVNRMSREAVPLFIDLLKSGEDELKRRALRSLVSLTGASVAPTAAAWQSWWDANKETWKPGEEGTKAGGGNTVVEVIRKNRKTDVEDLRKGHEANIVVVEGACDSIERVLEHMKIPHTKLKARNLATFDLGKTMALIINCAAAMPEDLKDGGGEIGPLGPTLTKAAIAKVRDFTARGGYLFTSDWGLSEVLEGAFPGYCRKAATIGDATVAIFPRKGATGHALLKEVFVKVRIEGGEGQTSTKTEEQLDFQWVIDGGTYTIEYDASKVTCLIEAPDLEDRKHTAVAVTFPFGERDRDPGAVATGGPYGDIAKMSGGRVLHVLSHFAEQATKNDEYAIQNMLLNFLIEAKDRKQLRTAGGKR